MKGESDADTEKGSFGASSFWHKTKILFGGVAMNWLVAFVILTVLAWMGMPHFLDGQFKVENDTKIIVETPVTIGEVVKDSPASKAGLRKGDIVKTLRSVGSESEKIDVQVTEDLLKFNDRHAGSTIYIGYEREGSSTVTEVKLNEAGAEYLLGAGIGGSAYYQSSWSAPIVGLVTTAQITGETFKGVGMLFYNLISGVVQQINPSQEVRESGAAAIKSAGDSVSGPVGIIGVLFPNMLSSGINAMLLLTAVISISLAVMNVLPIPALDGGHFVTLCVEAVRGKPMSPKALEYTQKVGIVLLLLLMVLATKNDIVRVFTGG